MTEAAEKQILVLDDEESMTRLCAEYLSDMGYGVLEAHDLTRAHTLIEEEEVHLVLCDLMLKNGESGLDLLKALLPRSPDIVACVMTARQDLQLAIDCLRDGAFDFIPKPFKLPDLLTSVERALARRTKMISEREKTEDTMRALARFPEDNPNPVFRVNIDGEVLYSNKAAQPLVKQWQIGRGDRLPRPLSKLVASHDQKVSKANAPQAREGGKALNDGESATLEVTSGDRIFSFTATRILNSSSFYLYGHDVTDWKQAEAELVRMKNEATALSFRDQLTGLHNRAYLEKRFPELIRETDSADRLLAFILIDFDKFKEINDIYGHETGDKVLIETSKQICSALDEQDVVCRWGGDEIAILRGGLEKAEDADALCRDLVELGKGSAGHTGLEISTTLSIGYSLYPDEGKSLDTLLQRADYALYRAKEEGKDTWKGYRNLKKKVVFRQTPELLIRFNQAVQDRQIDVHYQPLVDANTGRVVAAEALARWTDPVLGPISPSTFIPEAEERGLIDKVGRIVIEKAVEDLERWLANGRHIELSLNLSRRQLLNRDLFLFLNREIKQRKIPAASLTLEVTERYSFFDTTFGRTRLEEFAEKGYRLSIDDFGTGYSSLSEISSMPFTELKIGIGLTRQITAPKGKKIVHAISLMGQALGLVMVAEGVESQEQADLLREMGVHRLQGFLFARPMPAETFTEFSFNP